MMLGLLSSGETRDGGGAGGPQVDAVRVSTVRGHARILRWDRGGEGVSQYRDKVGGLRRGMGEVDRSHRVLLPQV